MERIERITWVMDTKNTDSDDVAACVNETIKKLNQVIETINKLQKEETG